MHFPITIAHLSAATETPWAAKEAFEVVLLSLSPDQDTLHVAEAVSRHFPDVPMITIDDDTAPDPVPNIERGIHEHIRRRSASVSRIVTSLHWVAERSRRQKVEPIPARASHVTLYDTLTDLPNRRLFLERTGQLLGYARRREMSFAVMFLDIDRFKMINDTLGHDMGDLVLVEVARRLESCLRSNDTVARWGGDEFTILLDGVLNAQNAARVARMILEQISRPMWVDGRELSCSASIGISLFPFDGADPDTLIRRADAAMYRTKSAGGGSHRFFDGRMHHRAVKRLELELALRDALEQGNLSLYYQPQFELSRHRLVGFEALMRWQHPELGMIPPNRFIPVAEETALILPLGKWALETACKQAADWQAAGLPAVPVAVNISPREIQQNAFEKIVADILGRTGIDPQYLELELTESGIMREPQQTVKVLARLEALGVRTSIDDFGTGFSSLSELRRFPISRLKIDRSFIELIPDDIRTAAITRAIIDMAHCLEMRTVAEGVERADQLEFLTKHGCDEAQGFLFARPVPAAEAVDFLRDPLPLVALTV